MVLLDPASYLPAPDTLEEAAELARELLEAAEAAAEWLAASREARAGGARKAARG